jgi:hypothetical protein
VVQRYLIAAVLLMPLLACGGNSSGPNSPTPNEVSAGSMAIAAGDFLATSFTLDTRTPLQTQIDWTVPSNDLDAFLIRGTCSRDDFLNARPACTMEAAVVGAATGTTKPESFTTAAVDAGSYTLLIVNGGSSGDTCTFRVIKTS